MNNEINLNYGDNCCVVGLSHWRKRNCCYYGRPHTIVMSIAHEEVAGIPSINLSEWCDVFIEIGSHDLEASQEIVTFVVGIYNVSLMLKVQQICKSCSRPASDMMTQVTNTFI